VAAPAASESAGAEVTPRPDPTSLTTEALRREVATLRELMEARIEGHLRLTEQHFAALDKATLLARADAEKVPQLIDVRLGALQALHAERFEAAKESVNEQHRSSTLAIAKSEAAINKQIDQISLGISTGIKSLDDKILDVKDRLSRTDSERGAFGKADVALGGGLAAIATLIAIGSFVFRERPVAAAVPPIIFSPGSIVAPATPPLPKAPP